MFNIIKRIWWLLNNAPISVTQDKCQRSCLQCGSTVSLTTWVGKNDSRTFCNDCIGEAIYAALNPDKPSILAPDTIEVIEDMATELIKDGTAHHVADIIMQKMDRNVDRMVADYVTRNAEQKINAIIQTKLGLNQ